MYFAAISPPRCPVPRPSSRSSDRKRTCARIFSGSTFFMAALAAAGKAGSVTILDEAAPDGAFAAFLPLWDAALADTGFDEEVCARRAAAMTAAITNGEKIRINMLLNVTELMVEPSIVIKILP